MIEGKPLSTVVTSIIDRLPMPSRAILTEEPDEVPWHEDLRPEFTPLVLPDRFWVAHSTLQHIRTAAFSRLVSPDAVLAGILVRIAAYTSHEVKVPEGIAATAALNFFGAVVGPPGAGKTSAFGVSGELLPTSRMTGSELKERPLGSGEGIVEAFMGEKETSAHENGDRKGAKKTLRTQIRHNALFSMDEGQTLAAFNQRHGSTTASVLRTAWIGSTVGQANASEETRRILDGGSYALGLFAAFQPATSRALLEDAEAGTPQRFAFFSALHPGVPDTTPPWPGPLSWRPRLTNEMGIFEPLAADKRIMAEIKWTRLMRVRGTETPDTLDTHDILLQLKAASLFCVLFGHQEVAWEDWTLAGTLLETSRRVRDDTVKQATAYQEIDEAERLERVRRAGERSELARQGATEKRDRQARRIAKKVDGGAEEGLTRRTLVASLASKERHLFPESLGYALAQQWVAMREDRYVAGSNRSWE